jgi:hypothetical protein
MLRDPVAPKGIEWLGDFFFRQILGDIERYGTDPIAISAAQIDQTRA